MPAAAGETTGWFRRNGAVAMLIVLLVIAIAIFLMLRSGALEPSADYKDEIPSLLPDTSGTTVATELATSAAERANAAAERIAATVTTDNERFSELERKVDQKVGKLLESADNAIRIVSDKATEVLGEQARLQNERKRNRQTTRQRKRVGGQQQAETSESTGTERVGERQQAVTAESAPTERVDERQQAVTTESAPTERIAWPRRHLQQAITAEGVQTEHNVEHAVRHASERAAGSIANEYKSAGSAAGSAAGSDNGILYTIVPLPRDDTAINSDATAAVYDDEHPQQRILPPGSKLRQPVPNKPFTYRTAQNGTQTLPAKQTVPKQPFAGLGYGYVGL